MSVVVDITETANRLSKEVLDCCFYIHTKLGPGLLESVYEDCLHHLLIQKGYKSERQKSLPIYLDDFHVPTPLRLDLLLEDELIIEIKSVEKLAPIHEAQMHTYLKLSGKPLGLLINFNVPSLKDGIKRIAMTRAQKNFA